MLAETPVDLGRRNLAREGAEGAELGDGTGEPGASVPVVVIRGAEDAIARADPDVIETDRHEAGRRLHFLVRVVDGLAASRRPAGLVEHLGRLAEKLLRRMIDEILGAGEEVAQLRRMRDLRRVDAVLAEEAPVERRV